MGTARVLLVYQSDSQQIVEMQYIIMCLVYTYVCVQCISVVHALSVCSFVIALSVRLSQSNMLHCILHLLKFVACLFTCVWSMHVVVASHCSS